MRSSQVSCTRVAPTINWRWTSPTRSKNLAVKTLDALELIKKDHSVPRHSVQRRSPHASQVVLPSAPCSEATVGQCPLCGDRLRLFLARGAIGCFSFDFGT